MVVERLAQRRWGRKVESRMGEEEEFTAKAGGRVIGYLLWVIGGGRRRRGHRSMVSGHWGRGRGRSTKS
jgi:hypothetical protein